MIISDNRGDLGLSLARFGQNESKLLGKTSVRISITFAFYSLLNSQALDNQEAVLPAVAV